MTLTAPQGYRPGGTWAVCDRCDFKRRHRELRMEWSGLLVCNECFDPRPADLSPPRVGPEGLPIRNARPDLGALAAQAPTPVTADTALRYWIGLL